MAKPFEAKSSKQVYELLCSGTTDEVAEYIRRIERHPKLVLIFKTAYEEYLDDHIEGDDRLEPATDKMMVLGDATFESFQELEEFISDMPSSRNLGLFYTFLNHGGGLVTIEIGWHDAKAGRVLWDKITGSTEDPVRTFALCSWIRAIDDYKCVPTPTEIKEPPMYKYHPERYKTYRDFAKNIAEIYKNNASFKTGLISLDVLNKISGVIAGPMNQKTLAEVPRRYNASSPVFIMDKEALLAMSYGRFVLAGRQIMDFPQSLTSMLSKTDVDKIPLCAIQMPFTSQFLHFGPQSDLEIEPGWFVDGAYVECRGEPGDIRFLITAVPTDHALSAKWYVIPEPLYTQDFIGDYRDLNLASAINRKNNEKRNELEAKKLELGGDITDKLKTEFQNHGEAFPEDTIVIDASQENALKRLAQNDQEFPVYQRAMRLVVNALCYLTAYPEDIQAVWPEKTPKGLAAKASSENPKESEKAKNKLASMGYVPIYFCGKKIDDQVNFVERMASCESGVATHWRRGHWRNQPHGPGASLRKLMWIMPTLVGSGSVESEVQGHIYKVV